MSKQEKRTDKPSLPLEGAGDRLLSYILSHIEPEGDYLYRLWRATNVQLLHGRMASGHLQGRLLKMLVEMIRPQYILEVGTFSGYSAICMAEGLKENEGKKGKEESDEKEGSEGNDEKEEIAPKIITFEINDEQEEFTRPWIENSPVAEYIDFRIGDAITEAPKLGMTFDMAFIDGDKRTYVETYEAVLPLMRPGGFILADNTLWDGHVCDPAYDHDQQTLGIREFNDYIAKDPRVEVVILPMRDGLTMIKVKK